MDVPCRTGSSMYCTVHTLIKPGFNQRMAQHIMPYTNVTWVVAQRSALTSSPPFRQAAFDCTAPSSPSEASTSAGEPATPGLARTAQQSCFSQADTMLANMVL